MVLEKLKQLINNYILHNINSKKYLKYYVKSSDGFIYTPKGHKVRYIKDPLMGVERIVENNEGLYFTQRYDSHRKLWITFPQHLDYIDKDVLEYSDVSDNGYPNY